MDKVFYFSYLLRVWRVVRDDELVWVASLEDPRTGKRQSFTSLEDLYAFLLKDIRQITVQNQLLAGSPQADQRKMNNTNHSTRGEKP
jgi:hypothetical protein